MGEGGGVGEVGKEHSSQMGQIGGKTLGLSRRGTRAERAAGSGLPGGIKPSVGAGPESKEGH